ncbi:pre-rRNA-processing protein esf1 [Lunasporangiospora selenospora]|uniref:Pre-rRNA-processing protein esf1 n=1 Tax=Lunasporangiospora selenospora TaxID=979761 RepID=A0A9P6FMS0_9FUNG|nr:pre-rRNA-processing protein esf1 [Lunasporangiospora selenospora]
MAPKGKKDNSMKGNAAPVQTDSRFAHVHRDPRFMRPQKRDSKVTIDSRFSSMLKDKEFSSAPRVDKYGRKLASHGSDRQMKRFYELERGIKAGSDEDDNQEDESDKDDEEEGDEKEEDEEDEESGSEDEEQDDVSVSGSEEEDSYYDPMRGRGVISGSDSDSEIDEDAAAELDREAEEYDDEEEEEEDDIPRGDESHRFACVNLDWDHIKSVDLFKVFLGFKPEQGAIRSVKIYPSEFGKERMEREERDGPPVDIFKKEEDSEDEEITQETLIKNQTEEGQEAFDSEALRQYQLDRLKYFYAVVDCDTVETAKAICEACDGTEYESSANFFDLRYIPDDMEFEDAPRNEAFDAPEKYKANDFQTQAFQHTNVKLTWDEDDADRLKVTRHKFSKEDLEDMDFKAYLASSDDDESDEDDDVEAMKRRYRALLDSKDSDDSDAESDDDKNQEMEITFAPGLSEAASDLLEAKKLREMPVKEETSIEAYKRKEKERKQRRKETRAAKSKAESGEVSDEDDEQGDDALFSSDEDERLMNDSYFAEEFAGDMMAPSKNKKNAAKDKKKDKKKRTKEERLDDNRKKAELELLMEDNRDKNQHFNMKEIQQAEKRNKRKKNKNKKDMSEDLQDDFKINVSDPRFAAMHDSHHFAIDPTNPSFKKTSAMAELMQERQKRTAANLDNNEKALKQKQKNNNNNKGNKNKKNDNNNNKKSKTPSTFEDPSLSLLVDTVKRKSAMATEESRNGKRARKA